MWAPRKAGWGWRGVPALVVPPGRGGGGASARNLTRVVLCADVLRLIVVERADVSTMWCRAGGGRSPSPGSCREHVGLPL